MNLLGKKFGRLHVLSFGNKTLTKKFYWNCRCDCGVVKNIEQARLISGKTKSCGCLRSDMLRARNFVHGKSRHHLYSGWAGMHTRCTNKNHQAWKWYGGKGIKVCRRWKSFVNFLDDMESGWKPGLELDRINGSLNYCKSNCRWSTIEVQMNNRSDNHRIKLGSQTKTVSQWARIYDINPRLVVNRINVLGWSAEKALTSPLMR